jgi:ornithine cyclodeaminase
MESVGAKIITVFHENYKRGLPSHQGVVVIFDADTGEMRGLVDGSAVTGIRTAAVSAVATDALAKKDASTLTLLGAGVQAAAHLQAISLVRELTGASVWSIDPDEAARFVAKEAPKFPFPLKACATVQEAADNCEILCTVTSSKTPILQGAWVAEGTHINAVGACQSKDRELDSECVAKARLFGDCIESVVKESGDYLIPLEEGLFAEDHLLGEIGDVLAGTLVGRKDARDITLFKSLGLAAEDIACAAWVINN